MEIQSTEGVKKYLALSMMQNVLKSSLGDGMEFEIVYQAILNQMETSNTLASSTGSNNITYAGGQVLEDIPLRIFGSTSYYNSQLIGFNNESSLNTSTGDKYMDKIYETVNKYSKEYDVDPKLVLAIIKTESNFDSTVVSSAGARGLMQLMPENCEAAGLTDSFDIDQNIRAGVKLLKDYINMYNGDIEMALMAYNAGPGTIQRRGVSSVEDLYKMPKETQNYVPKVMNYYRNGIN